MAGACLMHRRRVLKQLITYVGRDVRKETIAVALAAGSNWNEGGVWQDRERAGCCEGVGYEVGM